MSELVVEVVSISEVRPHPDPETTRLEVAVVKGWQTIVPKGKYAPGNVAIYVPPDALVPLEVSEHWGVTKYLGKNGRVKSTRLRGEMSFGFITEVEALRGAGYGCAADGAEARVPEVGEDVAAYYGITKWEPPVTFNSAELEPEHALFHHYTDIQLFENYPDLIEPGEQVVITEKIHGTNSRVGLVASGSEGEPPLFVCGSRSNQTRQGVGSADGARAQSAEVCVRRNA